MILTPLLPADRHVAIDSFADTLADAPLALAVFRRIVATDRSGEPAPHELARWHRAAWDLAETIGMAPLDEPPQRSFSWDGRRVRARTEPAVLFHEIAHYQLASAERRRLLDFGLGAGPETGLVTLADHVACVDRPLREAEEAMASLLGILWEVEHGQVALRAFEEQNWLEGAGRPGTTEFFKRVLGDLLAAGVIDAEGRPRQFCRITPDPPGAPTP